MRSTSLVKLLPHIGQFETVQELKIDSLTVGFGIKTLVLLSISFSISADCLLIYSFCECISTYRFVSMGILDPSHRREYHQYFTGPSVCFFFATDLLAEDL